MCASDMSTQNQNGDAVTPREPNGDIVIRMTAMPADTNYNGDIFGGWLMSKMDLGGAVLARKFSRSRVVTVAVDGMVFRSRVVVGDSITCYARVTSIGRTSMKIHLEVWRDPFHDRDLLLVTEGVFTYVAIDDAGRPHPVER